MIGREWLNDARDEEDDEEEDMKRVADPVERSKKNQMVHAMRTGQPFVVPTFFRIRTGELVEGSAVIHQQDGEVVTEHVYRLGWWQKMYVTLEYPAASRLGYFVGVAMLSVIILNVVVGIASSTPDLMYQPKTCSSSRVVCQNDANLCPNTTVCQPVSFSWLQKIDFACFVIFAIDYFTRFTLALFTPPRIVGLLSDDWDREESELQDQTRKTHLMEIQKDFQARLVPPDERTEEYIRPLILTKLMELNHFKNNGDMYCCCDMFRKITVIIMVLMNKPPLTQIHDLTTRQLMQFYECVNRYEAEFAEDYRLQRGWCTDRPEHAQGADCAGGGGCGGGPGCGGGGGCVGCEPQVKRSGRGRRRKKAVSTSSFVSVGEPSTTEAAGSAGEGEEQEAGIRRTASRGDGQGDDGDVNWAELRRSRSGTSGTAESMLGGDLEEDEEEDEDELEEGKGRDLRWARGLFRLERSRPLRSFFGCTPVRNRLSLREAWNLDIDQHFSAICAMHPGMDPDEVAPSCRYEDGKGRSDPDWPVVQRALVFFFNFSNMVDFASICPLFFILSSNASDDVVSTTFLRVIRCFRLLRVVKLNPYSAAILLLLRRTMENSAQTLVYLMLVALILAVLFAFIMHELEQGTFSVTTDYPGGAYLRWDLSGTELQVSPFTSVSVTMYYIIVTMTTLGYGDLYPTSSGGRALASIAAFTGILFIALPTSVIGTNFSEAYSKYKKVRETLEHEKKEMELYAAQRQKARRRRLERRQGKMGVAQTLKNMISTTAINNALSDALRKAGSIGSRSRSAFAVSSEPQYSPSSSEVFSEPPSPRPAPDERQPFWSPFRFLPPLQRLSSGGGGDGCGGPTRRMKHVFKQRFSVAGGSSHKKGGVELGEMGGGSGETEDWVEGEGELQTGAEAHHHDDQQLPLADNGAHAEQELDNGFLRSVPLLREWRVVPPRPERGDHGEHGAWTAHRGGGGHSPGRIEDEVANQAATRLMRAGTISPLNEIQIPHLRQPGDQEEEHQHQHHNNNKHNHNHHLHLPDEGMVLPPSPRSVSPSLRRMSKGASSPAASPNASDDKSAAVGSFTRRLSLEGGAPLPPPHSYLYPSPEADEDDSTKTVFGGSVREDPPLPQPPTQPAALQLNLASAQALSDVVGSLVQAQEESRRVHERSEAAVNVALRRMEELMRASGSEEPTSDEP